MNKTIKRFTALLLCLSLVIVNSFSGKAISAVYALGDDDQEQSIIIKMNGSDISLGESGINESSPLIYYGDDIEFTVDTTLSPITNLGIFTGTSDKPGKPDPDEAIEWMLEWGENGTTKWDIKPSDNISGYYVAYLFECGEDSYEDFYGNFGFRVAKGTFSDPTNLTWNDAKTVAKWDKVTSTTTSNNGVADGSVSYAFKLYKEGNNTPIYETTFTDNTNNTYAECDLSQNQDITKYGNYYFTVQAVPTDEAEALYNPGNVVSLSDDNYRIVEDVTAPTIKSFTGDNGVLTAVAADAEAGVKDYCFSTESSSVNITSWEALDSAVVNTDTELAHVLSGSEHGTYYVHVKDADGNTATSETTLKVTHIQYQKYYDSDNGLYTKNTFIVGDSIVLETPIRSGYEFAGWLNGENPVTASNITAGGDYTLTANWTRSAYQIKTQPVGFTDQTYDGQTRTLTAEVGDDVVGTISWTWYKVGAGEGGANLAIPGGEGKTTSLNVKDVADSGTYYAVATVTLSDGEVSTVNITSDTATVAINKRELTITANNVNLSYGDAAPDSYSYTYTGLIEGEESVLTGSFTSSYTAGDPAGTYEIAENQENTFAAGNYDITVVKGTLTVSPKTGGESVVVALADSNDASVTYNGTPYTPEVTVKDNGNDIAPENYTVNYSNNTNAGTATIIIVFKNNYSGEKSINFEIIKAAAEASIVFEQGSESGATLVTSWPYGTPVSYTASQDGIRIKANTTSDSEYINYYFLDSENNDITANGIPKNAGTYKVYVVIPETDNYQAVSTADSPVTFTIEKRQLDIMITGGYTHIFDGEEHTFTNGGYTLVNGTSFAPGEEFVDVEILGSITDVGMPLVGKFTATPNQLMDLDNNYVINIIPDNENNGDKIIITPQKLDTPTGLKWSKDVNEIGVAEWNGVSRGDMVSSYTVSLYRKGSDTADDVLVKSYTVDSVSHDFTDDIKNDIAALNADAEDKKAYDYYFTVSVSAKGNGNYETSETASGRNTAVMHTALVYNEKLEGINSISMGENSDGYIIMLQGETVNVTVGLETGYTNPLSYSDTDALSVKNPNSTSTSITLNDAITTSYDKITFISKADDDSPVIEMFTGETSSDGERVYIGFTASDSRDLTKWMISTSSVKPSASDSAWNNIAQADITNDTDSQRVKILYDKTKTEVTTGGENTYYAYVMDSAGNITQSEPLHVYVINFNKGNGDATGTMNSVFKVEDVSLTLPELKYVYPGYSFVNWKTATSTYGDKAVYSVNASDTLTAQWTDKLYSYTVEYYLQNTEGVYPETATKSAVFNCAYNTSVGPNTNAIRLHDEGFTLDADKSDTKTIDDDNIVLKLYYTRNQYNLKYVLTNPDNTVTETTNRVYYGAPVMELAKTELSGYLFIGWTYSDIGTKPATMPAYDLTATAHYKALSGVYYINYYLQDVTNPNQYNLFSSEMIESAQGNVIDSSIDHVSDMEGFTCVAHHSIYTESEPAGYFTVEPEDLAAYNLEQDPTVQATTNLNLNFYFNRNVYDLTFNLWNSEERTRIVYTRTWQVKYGTPIVPADYINDNAENWDTLAQAVGVDTENYKVSNISSWSTGITAPDTMPAGHVTVFRQYIPNLRDKFKVELYLQKADASYPADPDKMITYDGTIGDTVNVGAGDEFDVNSEEFEYYIPYYNCAYSIDEDNENAKLSGVVVDTSTDNPMLVLKVYLKRTVITATIEYIYKDINGVEHSFARVTRTGLWSPTNNTGNQFTFDPFLYFYGNTAETDETTGGVTANVNGVSPLEYNFNQSIRDGVEYNCAVSTYRYCNYTSSATTYSDVTNAVNWYFGYPYGYNGHNSSCYVKVYYTEIDVSKSYCFDFVMNKSVDDRYLAGETRVVPITYTGDLGHGEKTYKLREANLSDLVDIDFTYGAENPDYYASNDLKRSSSASGEVKSGYEAVEINGRTFYITNNEVGDNYIYFANTSNTYYPGRYASASYSAEIQGCIPFVTEWLNAYKERNADESTSPRDTKAAALGVYNRSNTVINRVNTDGTVPNQTVTVNFTYGDVYNLYINLLQTSGQTINRNHQYAKGSYITYANIMNNIAQEDFAARNGYEIKWYLDSNYTQPLELEDGEEATKVIFSNIQGDKYVYGRYEKKKIIHHLYTYYMTTDPDAPYLTIDDVRNDQGVIEGYTKTTTSAQVTYKDEENHDLTVTVKTDTYYKGDELVLKDIEIPGIAYSEITLTDDDIESYHVDGFYYDEANPDNKTYAYCEHSSVKFHIYYARNKHTLKIDNKYDKDNVVGSYIKRYGYTVTVQDPEKHGYLFDHWKVSKIVETDDGEGNITETHVELGYDVVISDADDSGMRSFIMPDDSIILEAVWEETAFDSVIRHYFQTENQSYYTSLYDEIQNAAGTGTDVTVTDFGAGKKYTINGTEIIETDAEFFSKPVKLYFSAENAEVSGTTYTMDPSDLVMATNVITAYSNDVLTVNDYVVPTGEGEDLNMFSFDFMNVVDTEEGTISHKDGVTKTDEDDQTEFTAVYGMDLDYFYTRKADLVIETAAFTTEGSETGLTLSGDGTYLYGKTVTVSASLGKGYTFKGWYYAADVLKNYDPSSNKSLSEYELDSDKLSIATPIALYTDTSPYEFDIRLTESKAYVAVSVPDRVDEPIVTVSGKNEYTYGYSNSSDNKLTAVVDFGDEADPDNLVVKSYQWYIYNEATEKFDIIAGATSGVYNFETGKNAGDYIYKCKVVVENINNGRSAEAESDAYKVTVNKKELTVSITDYSGYYDGEYHNITATVGGLVKNDKAVIYYSTEELTEDNYLTSGKPLTGADPFAGIKDVKVNDSGEVIPTDVYIYVVSADQEHSNYNNVAGQGGVTLSPKTVTITTNASAGRFERLYDGTVDISGSVSEEGTDKYKIAHGGYLKISGLTASDIASGESNNMFVDFTGTYNDKNVNKASKITLTNMRLVDGTGNPNFNYVIPKQLDIQGVILKVPVTVVWPEESERVFTYTGSPQVLEPTGVVVDEPSNTALADEISTFTINTAGAKVNVNLDGSKYTATAGITIASPYLMSNYKVEKTTCQFTIVPRTIYVKPDDDTVTYDGKQHGLDTFTLYESDQNTEYTLPSGFTAESYTYGHKYKDAGEYTITATGLVIKSGQIDESYNYDIKYLAGNLTIDKKKVKISKIKADDKSYDGTVAATLDFTDAIIDAAVEGETLVIGSTITGQFATPDQGTDKTVSIAYGAAPIAAGDDNTKLANYVFDGLNSQKTATADITGDNVAINTTDVTGVYGENLSSLFSFTYGKDFTDETFVPNTTDKVVDGAPSYKVIPDGKTTPVDYASNLPAGSYKIVVVTDGSDDKVVTGMSCDNYTFVEGTRGTLTINPRPVAIQEVVDGTVYGYEKVVKTYDGNTSVKTSVKNTGTNKYYRFTGTSGEGPSGIVFDDAVDIDEYTAAYNSEDVSDPNNITVTGITLTNPNYILKTADGNEVNTTLVLHNAAINKKELTVKVSDKTITYGDETPAASSFAITITGFVNNETKAVLDTVPTISCEYDSTDPAKRNAGTYTVTPTGGADNNYSFNYTNGNATLTVNKAVLAVVADDKSFTYSEGTVPKWTGEIYTAGYTKGSTVYTGLKYNDDANTVIQGSPAFACADTATVYTLPGTYTITAAEGTLASSVTVGGNQYSNYEFAYINGTLTVNKKSITVSGITINSKVYDGTTNVDAKKLVLPTANSTNYNGVDERDMESAGIVVPDASKMKYSDKNVGNRTVSLTYVDKGTTKYAYTLNEYLAARYTLNEADSQSTIENAVITKAPLTIKADDIPVSPAVFYYGYPIPEYTASYDGFVIGETKDVLGGQLVLTCDYQAESGASYSTVAEYTITPSGNTSDNYEITYVPGKLIVTANEFSKPVVLWSDTEPGVITWTKPENIGNVYVSAYQLTLYRADNATGEYTEVENSTVYKVASELTLTNGVYTYDYHGLLEGQTGIYKVQVTAVSSSNSNVKDSKNDLDTADITYSTLVTVQFADDDVSQAGQGTDTNTTINGNSTSYIMVAGDSDFQYTAVLKGYKDTNNDGVIDCTGYDVKSVASSNDKLTITTGNKLQGSGTVYQGGKASAGFDIATTSATITVTLEAIPAEVTAGLSFTDDPDATYKEITYGYTEGPEILCNVGLGSYDDGIHLTTADYTYTYNWKVKRVKQETTSLWSGETTGPEMVFPKDMKTYASGYYVECTVTATRVDNGLSTTNVVYKEKYVKVRKAQFNPSVVMADWKYGKTRSVPNLDSEHPEINDPNYGVTYYYSSVRDSEEYTTTIPKDVGTYYVKAIINATENYEKFDMPNINATEFHITQAKLAKPDGALQASPSAPYGGVSWKSVVAPKENAGAGGDSDSKIIPTYVVNLYENSEDSTTGGVLKKTETLSPGDIASELTLMIEDWSDVMSAETGYYYFTIQAISDNQVNCADSDLYVSGTINISRIIVDDRNDIFYDGNPITLSLDPKPPAGDSFRWFKDGVEIPGATGETYQLTNVSESGKYSCIVTENGVSLEYSTIDVIKINRRPITITTDGGEKIYDGTPLTKNVVTGDSKNYTITFTGKAVQNTRDGQIEYICYDPIVPGDESTIDITGTQTVKGTSLNIYTISIEGVPANISESGTVNLGNYVITSNLGTLEVTKKTLTITADSAAKTYDGTSLTVNTYTYGSGNNDSLAVGDSIESVTITGSQTVAGTSYNTPSEAIIKNASGMDVTASYEISYANGTLEVTKRPITITADSAEKVYDGTALEKDSYKLTVDNGEITGELTTGNTIKSTGDSITSVTVTGSQTVAGSSDNVPSAAVIKRGNEDVTESYAITYTNGTLEVTKKPITITADDASKTYDGTALTKNSYTNSTLATGDGIESVTITGSQTFVGTSNNVPSAAVIKNAAEDDVTTSYEITYANGTLEVTKKALKITAASETREYNATPLTNDGYSFTGLVNDDSIVSITVSGSQTVVGKGSNTPSAAVIKNKAGTEVTNSYEIEYVNGTLEVTKRPITITADSDTKVYDGTALEKDSYKLTADNGATTGELTTGNTINSTGDSIESVTVAGSQTVVGSSTNVPSAVVIKNAADEDVTASYDITYANGTLEVTKRPITITADSDTKVYDGTALEKNSYKLTADNGATTGELTTGNTINSTGDSIESVTVSGSQTVAESSDNVPSAAVIKNAAGTDVTASYDITYANGTLKVTKRPITITADSDTKVYDGTALVKDSYKLTDDNGATTGELTTGNTINSTGDSITSVTVTGSQIVAGSSDNVPSAAVIKNAAGTEDVTASYEITYTNGTLTVTVKSITLTAADVSKTYDGTALTCADCTDDSYLTDEVKTGLSKTDGTGLLGYGDRLDSIKYEGSVTTFDDNTTVKNNIISSAVIKNASDKDVTSCYNITYEPGMLKITKRPITITADSAAKVYDGTALTKNGYKLTDDNGATTGELTTGNTINSTGDSITSVTVEGSRTEVGSSNNVPSAAVIKNAAEVDVTTSYEITYANGTLEVTNMTVTITANNATKVYDGTALTDNGYTNTGLAEGDRIESVMVAGSQTVVGSSENVPSAAVIKNAAGVDVTESYTIIYVKGTLEVTKRPITITADSDTKVYDGTALEKNSYKLTDDNGETTGELTTGNTINSTGDSITSVTVTGSQTVAGSSANKPSAALIKNAADEDVTASYDITYANGTLEVTKRPITITADSDTKVYDGTALEKDSYKLTVDNGATTGELTTGNTIKSTGDSITSVTVTGSRTVAGSSANKPSAAVIKNAADEDVTASYNITYIDGTLTVTQKPVTITADSAEKTYDGTALTKNTATCNELAGDDTIVSATTEGSQTKVGSCTNKLKAVVINNKDGADVTASYNITLANGTLTVTVKSITLTAADVSKTYDGTALTCSGCTNDSYLTDAVKEGLSKTDGTGLLGYGDRLDSIKYEGSVTTFDDNTTVKNNIISSAVIKNASDENVTGCYDITYEPGMLTIDKRPVTITAESGSFRYDGQEHAVHDYVKTGDTKPDIAATDEIDISTIKCQLKKDGESTYTATAVNAGAYENSLIKDNIVIVNKETKADVTSSYDITTAAGALYINTGKIIVIADSDTKVYDGTALTVDTVSSRDAEVEGSTGLTDGETITATVTGAQTDVGEANSEVTSGTVKIMNGETDVTANYTIVGYETGKLTVTKRELTITAGGTEREYDGTELKVTDYTTDNLVEGHKVSDITWDYEKTEPEDGSFSTIGTITNKVSDAKINDGTGVDVTDNYEITYVDGESAIIKNDDVTFKTNSDEKTYDGKALVVDGYEMEGKLAEGDKIETFEIGTIPKDAGEYENKPSKIVVLNENGDDVTNNYDFGFDYGTVKINKRKVTFTAQGATKVYDGTELTNSDVEISGEGIVEGEDVSFDVTGSQTYVGSSENTFTYDIFDAPKVPVTPSGPRGFTHFDIGIRSVRRAIRGVDDDTDTAEAEDNYDITVVKELLVVTDEDVVTTKKSHEDKTYKLGDEIVFEITITNIYDAEKDITIIEQEGVLFENGTNEFLLSGVEPGETITVQAVHVVTEEDIKDGKGEYGNTVEVKFDGVTTEHSASDDAAVDDPKLSCDLEFEIISTPEDGSDTYNVGDTVTYQITLTNDGNQTFEITDITDTFTREDGSVIKLSDEALEKLRSLIGKSLKPGESISVSFDYQTVEDDKDNKLINTIDVTVRSGNDESDAEETLTDSLSATAAAVNVSAVESDTDNDDEEEVITPDEDGDSDEIPAKIEEPTDSDDGAVKTSDDFPLTQSLIVMLVSAAGIIFIGRRKKNYNENN